MVWYGPTSETAWMQKNWLKYTDLQSWTRQPGELTQTVGIFLLFFSNPSNFFAVRFVSLKKLQYKCAAYFTFNFVVHFSKEKKRVGFMVGFIGLY